MIAGTKKIDLSMSNSEFERYDLLKNIQEKVVPRVVAGGFDEKFCPRCMVFVKKKVGKCEEKEEDRSFVDNAELDRQDMLKLKNISWKG